MAAQSSNAQSAVATASGLDDPHVKAVLGRLHQQARRDIFILARMIPVLLLAKLKGVSPKTAIEPMVAKGFFGISAIYLAAAMRDNGGRFVGSEIEPGKVAAARRNLDEAGLSAFSEVREGDALETLRDLAAPFDLVLLDGWKDLVSARARHSETTSAGLGDRIFSL